MLIQLSYQVLRPGARRVLREQGPGGHTPLLRLQPLQGAGQEARRQGQLGEGQGNAACLQRDLLENEGVHNRLLGLVKAPWDFVVLG